MDRVQPSVIRELLALAADPAFVSFGGGYPDPQVFPIEGLAAAYQTALTEHGSNALQYATTEGIGRLREQIAELMTADGVTCGPEHVLVVQGAQQAIDLAGKLWLEPGDVVITESPTFLGGLVGLNPYEPRYRSVRTDAQGMDPEHLEEVLKANPRAKLIYTVPDFHNPTGYTLSLERRARIVELARAYDVIILEDTPYRELRFAGAPLPTLKSFDTDGHVYFIGSFSKTLAPGLRTAWIVASEADVERLALLKLATDTQNSTINMFAVSLFLDSGAYGPHLERIRAHYRAKRDHTIAALEAEMPGDVSFTRPEGGLFLWLTFPNHVDTDRLLREHLIPEDQVAFVPGASFYSEAPELHRGRLGFPTLTLDRISEGVHRIATGFARVRHLL